jgi:nucleoid DNA-binding protein
VELRRFGTFRCVKRAARRAVNPRTGQPVQVKARTVPTFKPSPKLREAVRKVKM